MERRGRKWVESMAKQASHPPSSRIIPNEVGTAPGFICENGGKTVIALPGPMLELKPMLEGAVRDFFAKRSRGVIVSKTLRVLGIQEAAVEQRILDLIKSGNPTVAPLVKVGLGEVHLRVTARAETRENAEKLIAPVAAEIRKRFGRSCYGEDDRDLATEVLDMLRSSNLKLATAESCTGGMLGETITQVSGASDVYVGGFVTYTNEMKTQFLDVSSEDLKTHGAVSEPVAKQMAEGAARAAGADFGIGITGIAGPEGGTDEKPVGLVYIALKGKRGTKIIEHRFSGDRQGIRTRSVHAALALLREELIIE